ncbi:uncharacterized protein LY89DRAFT_692035 [Mollisia scopiformis]|uniref:Uncharacterized protein n=1 Tax=Mollisia scopiformis TaxID=149040 RepID=A0A132B3J1_MOLSC|nr:uncharacterized protein LY89DRAFT_692035 [Mollisia scopiformis]KUJ06952.1 hypothetical protein LY89DRAFT_692035 [Mollisia scopiformis]
MVSRWVSGIQHRNSKTQTRGSAENDKQELIRLHEREVQNTTDLNCQPYSCSLVSESISNLKSTGKPKYHFIFSGSTYLLTPLPRQSHLPLQSDLAISSTSETTIPSQTSIRSHVKYKKQTAGNTALPFQRTSFLPSLLPYPRNPQQVRARAISKI